MADEPADVNDEVEETTAEDSSTEETNEQPTVEAKESTDSQDEAQDTEEQPLPEEGKPKRDRSAQGRIQQLVGEKKQLEQRVQNQGSRQTQQQYNNMSNQEQSDFAQYITNQYGGEIDPGTLNKAFSDFSSQQVGSLVDQRLQQHDQYAQQKQTFVDIQRDVEDLGNNELLDPESNSYDESLEQEIVDLWETKAKVLKDHAGNIIYADPNVRLKDVAINELNKIKKYSEKASARTSNTLQEQSESSAITPGGGNSADGDDLDALERRLEGMTF